MRYIDNLPWGYDREANCIDGRLRYVCDTGGLAGGGKVLLNEQDAKAAVQAVNYHNRLVEALHDVLDLAEYISNYEGYSGKPEEYVKARELLEELRMV